MRASLQETIPSLAFAAAAALLVLTLIPLYRRPLFSTPPNPLSSIDDLEARLRDARLQRECDLFKGEWVPDARALYYTATECPAIHDPKNCMKFGRPDTGFLKWRWMPDGCELPAFDPAAFLHLVRGKSLAFVGDSVGRNQMESLVCLLAKVAVPVDTTRIRTSDGKFQRWFYRRYDFTMAAFWSPFLVTARETDPSGSKMDSLYDLQLDEPDRNWTAEIGRFDYVVVSAGHWFFRPTMYYEGGKLVGCHKCQLKNVTDPSRLFMYYGYRQAFRTAFRHLNGLENFRGTTILSTFTPQHFENGEWNRGGDCTRTRPLRSSEATMDGFNMEFHDSQVEEYRAAKKEAAASGRRFGILDVTEAFLLRPDGHPGRYGHPRGANVTMYNDCVHWCLPGPIDSTNDFLLELLKRERVTAAVVADQLHASERKSKGA